MIIVRLALIGLYTLVLGTITMLTCLVLPGGRSLLPLARLWSRLVLVTSGVRWTARQPDPPLAAGPFVYVANHQSLLDIPALVLAMSGNFRIVAKRELLPIPIFGWALWLAGFVFIDRTDRERAIRSFDRASRKVRGGMSMVVFAEGTRSRDGRLLAFKKGGFLLAMQAGVPIVPVAIRGGHAVLSKGTLNVRPGTIEVIFGEPVETAGHSYETRDALIAIVRSRIEEHLGAPGSRG